MQRSAYVCLDPNAENGFFPEETTLKGFAKRNRLP